MKIGGIVKVRYAKDKEVICLIKEEARHIYKKVQSDSVVNVATIKQEIEEDKLTKDNTNDKVNPYQKIVINTDKHT